MVYGIGPKGVAAEAEAARLRDAARSAEITGARLVDPLARRARIVAIDRELSGRVHPRRRERLESERAAIVEVAGDVVASKETVRPGDIITFRDDEAAVIRSNVKTATVGHWFLGDRSRRGSEHSGVQFGRGGHPLGPIDPVTGKAWDYTMTVPWHLVSKAVRDGVTVFEL